MSTYLDDNFEAYAIGGVPGGGWFDLGAPFSNGIIYPDPPSYPGSNSIASSSKCCRIGNIRNVWDGLGVAYGLVTFSFRIGNTNVDSISRTPIFSLTNGPTPGASY